MFYFLWNCQTRTEVARRLRPRFSLSTAGACVLGWGTLAMFPMHMVLLRPSTFIPALRLTSNVLRLPDTSQRALTRFKASIIAVTVDDMFACRGGEGILADDVFASV